MSTRDDIENVFSYHAPHGTQADRYAKVRDKARELAVIIHFDCPTSPEKDVAIGKLREVVMWANASIACNES